MEYNAWGNPVNEAGHEANLVFTRMLSGPMDYTPGVLSLKGADGRWFNSTQAKQLANFVAIYSPVVMAADVRPLNRWPDAVSTPPSKPEAETRVPSQKFDFPTKSAT